jgi:tetratricopeptide repeat protein|nr:hypothetical protein [uncultured Porphyromonas sp.]
MKLNRMILVAALGLFSTAAYAQTGKASGTPFGSGQDSIRCRQSISLFTSLGKTGNYQDAYEHWKRAYDECPASSKNIYIIGAKILQWKLKQAKDDASKKKAISALMKLYDDRATYFGDDPKMGADQIMLTKTKEYVTAMGDKADFTEVYTWLKPVVARYKGHTPAELLYYFAYSSRAVALRDKSKAEQYIKDYLDAAEYVEASVEATANNPEARKAVETFKNGMDAEFAQSGLAGCEMLTKIYTTAKIEAHKKDKSYLTTAVSLFSRAGCNSNESLHASKYLFDIEPSATAAMQLAGAAIEGNKLSEASEYLNKAIELAKSSSERIKCYEVLIQLSMKQNNMAQARNYANKVLAENPNSGQALIVLAQMTANAASSYFPDDKIKQRCVYYLVINKLRRAASVDPKVAGQANRLIATYSRFLPSAQDIFMHPEIKKGSTLNIGGESVVIP